MRLKVLTTTLLISGILLMLAWPIAVGMKPGPKAPRREVALWGQRIIIYFGVTSSVWLSTAMSAVVADRPAAA